MEAIHLPFALALALIKAKRKKSALIVPVSTRCAELQEELDRVQAELSFLKKKQNAGVTSRIADVRLNNDQICNSEVWQFFTKGDQLQKTLESKAFEPLDKRSDGDKEVDMVVSQCVNHISKITGTHWQPDDLFGSCVHFLVSASHSDVLSPQRDLIERRTKEVAELLLNEIILFSCNAGKHERQRDHASEAVIAVAKCGGTGSRIVEVIFKNILGFINEKTATYQTLENLFFYCWILEAVVRIAAENAKEWPTILSTIELLAQNVSQASNLPPLFERYIYKIILNLPKPANCESQVDTLQQSQLCFLLGKIEKHI